MEGEGGVWSGTGRKYVFLLRQQIRPDLKRLLPPLRLGRSKPTHLDQLVPDQPALHRLDPSIPNLRLPRPHDPLVIARIDSLEVHFLIRLVGVAISTRSHDDGGWR